MSRRHGRRAVQARPDVVGVVVVPPGREAWLVSARDLDGDALVVHAARAVLEVAGTAVVLAPDAALPGVRAALAGAGLARVAVAGVTGRDLGTGVADALGVPAGGLPEGCTALLVHDPLCPLAPAEHLDDVLLALRAPGGGYRPGAAVHPMTDTVKIVHDDSDGFVVAGTVDRDGLRVVTTPVLVPAGWAHRVPVVTDGPALVTAMRRLGEVELVAAPPIARRVDDVAELHLVMGLREVEEHRGRPAAAP